jgi:hypothetical protein
VTPQQENPRVGSSNQRPFRRYIDPPKVYKRRVPPNSPVIRTLFNNPPRVTPMALQPWVTNAYKALDMFGIQGYPHNMPDRFDKWLPKFSGNNVITIEEHLSSFYDAFEHHPIPNEHEDVVMKLFSISLEENARSWYNSLPEKSIKSWQAFHDAFMKIWVIRKDGRLMLTQFHEIKKKDNETIREFDQRFGKLVEQIPDDLKPRDGAILLQYTNAFDGKFGFMLRDKFPKTLEEAQEWAGKIEENMLASKVEPFNAPCAKAETKPRTMNNVDPISRFYNGSKSKV